MDHLPTQPEQPEHPAQPQHPSDLRPHNFLIHPLSLSLNINWSQLGQEMLTAAEGLGIKGWTDAEPYAKGEFTKYLGNLAVIKQLLDINQIDQPTAKLLDQMQKNAMQAVLCTVEGIGLLVAEQIINAALGIIQTAVNTAIGFALI